MGVLGLHIGPNRFGLSTGQRKTAQPEGKEGMMRRIRLTGD